jgi:hypothetical protein
MPAQTHHRRRRTWLKLGIGVGVLVCVATVSREARRLVVLGLYIIMWLSMIVIYRLDPARGRSFGLLRPIVFVGLGLLVLGLMLVFDE